MVENTQIYDSLPEMIHSINRNGELIYVNQQWLKILRYESSESVLGKRSVDFLTPESREFAEKTILPAFFKNGYCKDIPYQFIRYDRNVVDVLLSASSSKDSEGNVINSLAILKDVTQLNYIDRQLEILKGNNDQKLVSLNSDTPIEKLKQIRKKEGLKQEEMATLIGVANRSYQRIEHGEKPLTAEMIITISKKLNLDPSHFFILD
ncbi:MAG: PAS domain-containing protein [Bacteriovoracaceae bacterium]|nr:PAS domain-containing protein [Bacteriovoracaceae bacterium]